MNLKEMVKKDIYEVLKDSITYDNIIIENPKDPRMGDYAVPCFSLSKVLRKSPNDIANMIKEQINSNNYEKIEVVNGYLNIFLKKQETIKYLMNKILSEKASYGDNNIGDDKTIVIDYSSPNIAKPFGVGHLRTTVIGNSIKLICRKLGYKVVSINHLGDWGTQFGKLIYAYKEWGNEEDVKKNPIDELKRLYVLFHKEAENDPSLEEEGRKYFKLLEENDPECLKIWQWFKDESIKEFNKTYNLLKINDFDSWNGEAFYNDKLDDVIKMLEDKHLLEISEGATIVKLEDDLPPALIKKTDGASLYITRDLAAIIYRANTYHFDEIIYVVGNEQTLHFKQLTALVNKLGLNYKINHVSFGMVLQNGKKMSTRQGKSVKLHDVLEEAIKMALKYIEERNTSLDNKEEVSHKIGIGAVIFNDLKNYRTNDIAFNLEDMLKFEGETGPYVSYTYARINSLLKNKKDITINYDNLEISEYIWNIVFKLYEFSDIIVRAKDNYDPSEVAKYLLDLCSLFNKFYASEKIIDEDNNKTEFKLTISNMTAIVIKEGMRLLGIEVPEKM